MAAKAAHIITVPGIIQAANFDQTTSGVSASDTTLQTDGDIVVHASDVTAVHGNWVRVDSPESAGGSSMASVDLGWSAVSEPLAAPASYFEASFVPEPNRAYRVWLRLRAGGDSKYNDSVWVQFSGAVDAGGAPLWSLGSTSALLVNLEACQGCGVAGWGWQRGAWWLADDAIVRFPVGSPQTVRVQTREDGVEVDQIILSPSTYFNEPPGEPTNDATIVAKSASNEPPTVSITSPSEGSTFTAPATITVTASAADTDGRVKRVDFYAGSQLIGSTGGNAPSVTWSSVAAGTYTLTAVARDNKGMTTRSAPITVIVSGAAANAPPTVSMTAPVDGATFTAPATIVLAASASDTDGSVARVDFYAGAQPIGSATASPWTTTWSNVAAGTYVVTAVARDDAGATTTSPSISVTVDPAPNQPPTVSIASPWNGATFTAPATIIVTASAADADGTVTRVDFYAGSQSIGAASASPWSITWSNVAAGTYALTAVARDNAGATRTSAPVSVTVNGGGNQPPTVSIVSPANGATFPAPATITIAAAAADAGGAVIAVDFYAGSQFIGGDMTSPFGVTWNNVPAGTYALTAVALDNSGDTTTSAAVTVTVGATSNQPPTVSIVSPANGASFTAPATITVTASAADADGGVTLVDFFSGSQGIGSDTSTPFSINWSSVAAGTYTLTARARDTAGASTTSAGVTVTVSAEPSPTAPTTLVFGASPDHDLAVDFYSVAIYRATDPITAFPVATRDLGKPAPVGGEITSDISAVVNPLAAGSYYAVVRAVGAGGSSSSLPSEIFSK